MMKIIFYHPDKIVLGKSGSSVRPYNMLLAFRELGVEVEVIDGNDADRTTKGKKVMAKIKAGANYDFIYIENTTLPLGLTIKKIPFLNISYYGFLSFDKKFIQFCLNQNISCKYYFRDIHWGFPETFENNHSLLKNSYLLAFQKYFGKKELKFLKKNIQVYVPSSLFQDHLKKYYNLNSLPLSPGSTIEETNKTPKKGELTIIYVGAVSSLYFSDFLIEQLGKLPDSVKLILCCRQKEYSANSKRLSVIRNKEVYHLSGNDLNQLYSKANVALYPLKPTGYGKLAYSIKIPEYICKGKPIIAFKKTVCSEIIEKDTIGWAINMEEVEIKGLVNRLLKHPEEIILMTQNVIDVQAKYTWEAVAKKVIEKND